MRPSTASCLIALSSASILRFNHVQKYNFVYGEVAQSSAEIRFTDFILTLNGQYLSIECNDDNVHFIHGRREGNMHFANEVDEREFSESYSFKVIDIEVQEGDFVVAIKRRNDGASPIHVCNNEVYSLCRDYNAIQLKDAMKRQFFTLPNNTALLVAWIGKESGVSLITRGLGLVVRGVLSRIMRLGSGVSTFINDWPFISSCMLATISFSLLQRYYLDDIGMLNYDVRSSHLSKAVVLLLSGLMILPLFVAFEIMLGKSI